VPYDALITGVRKILSSSNQIMDNSSKWDLIGILMSQRYLITVKSVEVLTTDTYFDLVDSLDVSPKNPV
jgi:hypothetical protein